MAEIAQRHCHEKRAEGQGSADLGSYVRLPWRSATVGSRPQLEVDGPADCPRLGDLGRLPANPLVEGGPGLWLASVGEVERNTHDETLHQRMAGERGSERVSQACEDVLDLPVVLDLPTDFLAARQRGEGLNAGIRTPALAD